MLVRLLMESGTATAYRSGYPTDDPEVAPCSALVGARRLPPPAGPPAGDHQLRLAPPRRPVRRRRRPRHRDGPDPRPGRRGLLVTVDHLGEDVTDPADAGRHPRRLRRAADRLDDLGLAPSVEVSVKLSALGQALPGDGHRIARTTPPRSAPPPPGPAPPSRSTWRTTPPSTPTLEILATLRARVPVGRRGAPVRAAPHRGRRHRPRPGGLPRPAGQGRLRRAGRRSRTPAKAEVDEAYLRCLRILMAGPGLPDGRHPRPAHDRGRPRHGRRARP